MSTDSSEGSGTKIVSGPFSVTVITLFPELFQRSAFASLSGKALDAGKWKLRVINLRTHGLGKHKSIDEPGFGGGPGMILRPDVAESALVEATTGLENPRLILPTPRGALLTQAHFQTWTQSQRELIFFCGRYEGIDERVMEAWKPEEISLGDFVLCGGELPAHVIIEGCVRLLEGVMHNPASLHAESFQGHLLEYPHYTQPRVWKGHPVPQVLLSGHHAQIRTWQREQAEAITQKRRPDLWEKYIKCTTIESMKKPSKKR